MVGDPQHPHVAVGNSVSSNIRNAVYKEILQTGEVVFTPTLPRSLQNSDHPRGAVEE